MLKSIAVLTSGGDSPGMNPAVRAIARTGIGLGIRVFGFYNGYQGIFDGDIVELTDRAMSGILDQGGTILQSSRCKSFYSSEGRAIAARRLRDHGIDGLVVIGGDGSLRGALELTRLGFSVIGLPGTIDNDIYGTEMGIGVDTASNTIVQLIDKIKDTARSHQRCFLVEVMGRNCGYLALMCAISAGAEVAVIPEFRYNMGRILELLDTRYKNRRNNSMIILAEGVCEAEEFIRRMQAAQGTEGPSLNQEIRRTVLGHVQRGGTPSHFDRLMASRMGELATIALNQGERGVMVGLQNGKLTLVDLEKVVTQKKRLPLDAIRLARHLGIELGDVVET